MAEVTEIVAEKVVPATKGLEILSDLIVYSKYAKYLPNEKRRETWDEIVRRYMLMMMKKYPQLADQIALNIEYIRQKKVLPSMRALQFAGEAAEVNNARIYNCAYLPIDSLHSFSETMFLLLGGSGVGYSVQKQHIDKLPEIKRYTKTRRFLVQDDIMGWADAVKVLMKAFLHGSPLPLFDYRAIRPKGARLVTAGGKAPGHEPLELCLGKIKNILEMKDNGSRLTDLECHDIQCHIANAVLAGGIRRAAMIVLFDRDSKAMLTCKQGEWWKDNEQRGRCNNSAVLPRGYVTEQEFKDLWREIEASNCGEPGIYWTHNTDWGTNPCCEVALRAYQFCNLCEVNVSNVESQWDLNERVRIAAFFGTLQAGFTDFHYLRPVWKKTTEKDALIGVGMTGIGSGEVLKYDLSEAATIVEAVNHAVSRYIGINQAARQTLVKPAGTTSGVLMCSSGIHAWHNDYYIRTMRLNKSEDLALYLMVNHPELVEQDQLREDTICVRIPCKAPEGSILRTETAIDLLERVKKFSKEWIEPGHMDGENSHNVSATISIDKNRNYMGYTISEKEAEEVERREAEGEKVTTRHNEWEIVGAWMWYNRQFYNGLSVLPYSDHTYVQAPFEDITKEEFEERVQHLSDLDLSKIIEIDDTVHFGQVAACAGGQCNID